MEKLYLSDLSHTTAQGLTSEFIPYAVGCLKSYFKTHATSRDHYEIRVFQDPIALIAACEEEDPAIFACSNYSWNGVLSYALAEEAKRRNPDTLVVLGGPNYPLENGVREKWMQEHPAIDVYVVGEGEKPFTEVVDHWTEHHDIEVLKRAGIEGVHALIDGKLFMSADVMPRLSSIDEFPSPYVAGYLDEFLDNPKLIPLSETNRGCPFSCTFCEKGIKNWNKLTKRSGDRFEEEIRYIAQKTESSFLLLSDNNFGMLKEDLAAAQAMTRCYNEFGYPAQVYSATGKARYDRVLEAVNALEGRMPVTMSVQSLDDDVLKNIKRKNLPLHELMEVSGARYSSGTRSRSEVILALPGDTREKHIGSLCQLVDMGVSFVLAYTLILLDGSEMGTLESRKKWGMQSKYRLNHRCFGNYQFGEKRLRSAEIEEVVVGLNTLDEEDYHECRLFYLSVGIFYMDEILFELLEFLKLQDIKISDFLRHIHEAARSELDGEVRELYDSYARATRQELWPTRKELVDYMETKDRTEADIREMGGYNVIYYHRAWAFSRAIEQIIEAAFASARALLDDATWSANQVYLDELKAFMILRKRNVFDYEQVNQQSFHYDFMTETEKGFQKIPARLKSPIPVEFYHTAEQKRLFGSFNPGRTGAARALAKLQMSRMYRTMRQVDSASGSVTA